MSKLTYLLIPVVLATQISLSPKRLIPASWIQEYRDAASVISLLFRGLQTRQQEQQPAEQQSDCPSSRGARVYALAWSTGELSEPEIIAFELRQAEVEAEFHKALRKLHDLSKRHIPLPEVPQSVRIQL